MLVKNLMKENLNIYFLNVAQTEYFFFKDPFKVLFRLI